MIELIDKIIDKSWIDGWDILKQEKNNLLSFDEKEVLINLLNHPKMDYSFMESILLVLPELWKDFNLEDWLEIIRNIDRPSNYRILFDTTAHFEDIKFLYNWIEIDSIKLYQNDLLISDDNKNVLDKVIPKWVQVHSKVDSEMLAFRDGTYGDYKYIQQMKERLINQGAKAIQ